MGQPEESVDEAKGFQARDDIMDAILVNREEDLKEEVEDSGGELLPDKDDKEAEADATDKDEAGDDTQES